MAAPQALTLSEAAALLAVALLVAAVCFILPWILALLIKTALSKADVVDGSVSVSVSLGLRPVLRLRLRGVLLSNKLLRIINSGWGAALPLVMTRAAVQQLSLELDLAELVLQRRLPCVVLDGVEVQAHITHQEDWSVQAEILRWIERKHAMANYLTKILSGETEEPKVTAVATVIDWVINNARLTLQRVHLRIEDLKLSHAMGLQLAELSISPEAPSEGSLWEVPRAVVMRDFAFYVDLHGLNVTTEPGADHHYMLRFSKVEVCIEFPDILGVLIQPGTMPFGRGKRMRIFGDFYHARPLVHQVQMPTFLFEMLKAFGPFEYLPWKSQVAKQLEDAAQNVEAVDIDAYLSLCTATERTPEQLANMKAIEARLPLSEIMSLRRQAYGWTFEVPSLDAPRDPLLQYPTDRFDDDAMSAKSAALRPAWDSERYSLRELYYAPLRFHDFNAELVAFVPGTSDSLLHNTLSVEHMEAFCRILLARNEKGVTTGAAGAGEPAVKFLETGGSLRRVVLRDERRRTSDMPSSCLLQPTTHNGSQSALDDIEHISGSYKLDSNWNQFIEGEVNGCTIAGGALREILDMVWVIVASFRRGDLGGPVHAPTIDVAKLWAIPCAELCQTLAGPSFRLEAEEAALAEAPGTHTAATSHAVVSASAVGPSSSLLLRGLKMVIDASLVDVDVVVFPGTEYRDSQLQLLQVAGRFLLDSKSLQELMAVQLDKLILRPAMLQHSPRPQLPQQTTHQTHQTQRTTHQTHQTQRWNMHVQKRALLSCKSISATYAASVSCTVPHKGGHAPHHGRRHERSRFVERRICVAVDYGSFIDISETIDGMTGLRHPSLVVRVDKQERCIESINRDTLAPQFAQQLEFYVLYTDDFATSPTQPPTPKGVQVELYDNETANGGEPRFPFIRSPGVGPTYLGSGILSLAPDSLNCWQRVSIVSAAGVTLGDLLMKADMTDPMFAVEVQSISRLRPQLQRRYSDSTMVASDIHNQPRMYLTVCAATTSPSTDLRSRRATKAPSAVGVATTRARPFTQRTKPFPPREAVSLSEVFYFPATPDSDYLLEFRLVAQDNRSTEEVACAELVFRSAEPLAVPLVLRDSRSRAVAEISVSVDWSRSGKAPAARPSAHAAEPHDPREMRQQIAALTQAATTSVLPSAASTEDVPSRPAQHRPDDNEDDDDISVRSELSISGFEGGRDYRANSLDWMDAFFDDTKQEHFVSPAAEQNLTTVRRHVNLHARTFDLELLEQDVVFALASARTILNALKPAPQPVSIDGAAVEQLRAATTERPISLAQDRAEADKAAFAAILQELLQVQQLTMETLVNKQVARTFLGELKRHGNLTAPEWAELQAEIMQQLDNRGRLSVSEFVDWLLALAQRLEARDADGTTSGRIVPVCQELCSPIWSTTLLESQPSVRHAIASSDGHAFVDRVWENLGQLLEDVSVHAPPRIGAKLFQAKLVRALRHYSLARDVWRYIIVPTYLQLPLCFDVSAGNGMQCLPMVSPVTAGTKVFLDHDCTITSLPPLLRDRPLAGICTYKTPRQGSKPTLEFTLSRAALVYVCMDCHCGLPSNWFAAEGFTRIDGTVDATDGNYSVFGKLYEVAGPVRLGKRFHAHGQRCSYFLLLQAAMGMQEAQAVANANFDCRWQLQGNWSLAKSVVSDGLRVADEDSPSVADVRSPVTASDETRVTPASSVRQCILIGADIGGFAVRLLDPLQRIALVQLTLDVLSTQLMLARVAQADTPFLLAYDDVAKGHLDLGLRGTCYNQLLAAHEPFLEPWDARLQLSKSANSATTFCSIDTSRRLAIDVTAQLHQTLYHTLNILRRWQDNAFEAPAVAATATTAEQVASARSGYADISEEPWSSVVIRNGVGEPVLVQLSNASRASDGSQTLLVLPDEAVTIRCLPDGAASTPPRWLLSVRLPATGVEPLKDVLVGEVGERIYPVRIADMLQMINDKTAADSRHANSARQEVAQYEEFYASTLDRLQLRSSADAEIEPLALVLETKLLPRLPDGRLVESLEAEAVTSEGVAEAEFTVVGGNALELLLRTNVCIENQTTTPIAFRTALAELEAPQRLAAGDTLPMPLYQLLRQRIQFARLGPNQAPESLQLSLGVLNPLLAPGLRRPKEFIEKSVAVKVTSTREALSTTQTSGFELEAGEQADTADTPSAAATEAAVAEASSATQPEGGKRSSKSRLGAFFSRSKRSVAPVVIPTADWSLVFLPAYEIVNALPCSIAIHVDQPPRPTKLRRDASRKQDGARDLFFLPDQFYVRDSNGDPIIAAPDEADDGDWVPFHTDICRVTHVPPGATVPLDTVDLDRTMAVRVSIPGTGLISEDIMIAAHVHNARLAFQKHRPQLLRWLFANQISLAARRGAPQLRVKREWAQQGTRTLLLYSSIWVVNKTGMSLRYKSFVKQSTSLPSAVADVDEKLSQHAAPSGVVSATQPLKRKLLTDCTTADSFYEQVFGEQAADAVPVMLDCPAKKLAVLPYAMASDRNPLYLYDLRVKSSLPYRCLDTLQAGASLRTDRDVALETVPGCCAERRTICVQTPSVDPAAHTTEEPFMTFMLPMNAFVYIGLPEETARAGPLPWMVAEGYRIVPGETVRAFSEASSRTLAFRLFSKFYAAGSRVALGGTASSLFESTGLTASPPQLYVVCVGEAHDAEAEPAATDLQIHRDITDSVLCRARYAWHPRFSAGSKPYVDRDYRITALPHPLDKMALLGLQTAQGDKWSTADRLVTFHLEQASEVLVCLDRRSRHPPLWLKSVGFAKLGLTIPGATEGYHYDVYSKSYDGGLVVLGGNGRAGGKRNYFVLIAALEEFLQWMPRADGIHHAYHHSSEDTVLQTMADGKSIHQVWESAAEGELLHMAPSFAALRRRWSGMVDVKSRNVGELVTPCGVFGVKVTPLSGLLHRTAMVTLLPRFILVNQLGFAVRVFPCTLSNAGDGAAVDGVERSGESVASSPPGCEKAYETVPPGASCVLYDFPLASPDTQTSDGRSNKSLRRVIVLQRSYATDNLPTNAAPPLSQPVFVEEVGQQFVWLVGSAGAGSSGDDHVVVSATMSVENPIVYILLQDVTASPPYRLENRSPTTALLYKQDPSGPEWKVLPPLSWCAFVIESPWADRELLVAAEGFEQQPRRIVLDSVGQTEQLVWQAPAGLRTLFANLVGGGQQPVLADVRLAVRVVVGNRTRVVQFYDVAPTPPSVRYSRGASLLDTLCTELRIVGVDVSLIDSGQGSSMELLCCSIEGIFVRMDGAKKSLDVSVYHVQVDDHRPQARFPVVLGPLDSGFNSHLRDEKQEVPMLRFRARGHDNAADYLHLAELEMVMQELFLKLDMQYILQLVAFLGKFTANLENTRGVEDIVLSAAAENMLYRANRPAAVGAETFVFLEVFHHSSLLLHTEIYVGQRVIDLDPSKLEGSIAHGFLLLGAPVMSSVSAVLSSVAHTSPSFVFNELVVENFFGEPSRLVKALQLSFTQQAIAQSYKLFGSMEVLGDPLSLVGNLGTGVVEFFRRTGAEMIGDADTRGAGIRKLLKGVVGGTFNSASKISGSLADIVQGVGGNAPLERRFSARPVDLQSGLRQGGEVFVDSLRSGFKGVVAEPRRGLEEGGMVGAVGGVFRGVLGLATAPIVGSLGAVARFTEGVDALAKFYHGRPMGRRRAAKRLDAKKGTILPPLEGVWEQNLPARFGPEGDGPLPLLVPAFVPCGKRQWVRQAVNEEVQMLGEDLPEDQHSRRESSPSSGDEDVEDADGDYDVEQAPADRL